MGKPTRYNKLNDGGAYSRTAEAYEIAAALGWQRDMHAVAAVDNGKGVVMCTGTLLKTDEWHDLVRNAPTHLADGRPVYVVNLPAGYKARESYRSGYDAGKTEEELQREAEALIAESLEWNRRI